MEYPHVHDLQLSPTLRIKLKAPKATNVSLQSNFVDNLRHFRSQNKLKKAVTCGIAVPRTVYIWK
jgi:hypothetical protein